jgi:hypothetical protein
MSHLDLQLFIQVYYPLSLQRMVATGLALRSFTACHI